jgi:hypothetical protein
VSDHLPDVLPARSLKAPSLWGVAPKTLKPVKPSLPYYGGSVFFRGKHE